MSKKFTLIVGLLVIGSLIFVVGCFDAKTSETTENTDSTETTEPSNNETDSTMKKVDFKNFSFPLAIDAKGEKEKSLTLKDGKSAKTNDAMGAELESVQYADLTDDKKDEAIINLGIVGEKDAKSNMVYVYTLVDGKPKLLWDFEIKGGEKVGLKEIKAHKGKLLVEMFGDVKFSDGKFKTVESKEKDKTTKIELKWNGKTFEAVDGGKEEKKEEKKEERKEKKNKS